MAGRAAVSPTSARAETRAAGVAFVVVLLLGLVAPSLPVAAEGTLGWQSTLGVYEDGYCACDGFTEAVVADPTGWATAAYAKEDLQSQEWRLAATRINLTTGAADEPVNITPTEGTPTGIRLAADERGHVLALWSEYDSSAGVNYSLFRPGVGWSLPAPVYNGSLTPVYWPSLSMNADGRALLVWSYKLGNYTADIWAVDFTLDDGWGTPHVVRARLAPMYMEPQARIDDAGGALLVYATGANLTAVHRSAAGEWGGNETVRVAGHSISDFSFAVSPTGSALLAWMDFSTDTNATMQASLYSTSTGWSAARNLTGGGEGQGQHPHVGADAYGNFMVEWRQWQGRQGPIVAQRYNAAAGWEDRTTLAEVEFEGWTASLVMDPLGNAYATWWQENNSLTWPPVPGRAFDVKAAVYTYSVGWGNATVLGPREGGNDAPRIAADGRGNAVALWGFAYGLHARVYLGAPDTTPPVPVLAADGTLPTTNQATFVVTGSVAVGDRVWINGVRVAVDPTGAFSAPVNLSDGPNEITVLARDPAGNTATRTLFVLRTNDPGGTTSGARAGGDSIWLLGLMVGMAAAVAAGALLMRRGRRPAP